MSMLSLLDVAAFFLSVARTWVVNIVVRQRRRAQVFNFMVMCFKCFEYTVFCGIGVFGFKTPQKTVGYSINQCFS